MPKSYHPPKSLTEAIIISKTIYEQSSCNPMYRVTLAHELSENAESRKFRELITASSGYGLTKGSRTADQISLLDRGKSIIENDYDAIYEALFSVDTFKSFYDHFMSGSGSLPSEKVISDYFEKNLKIPMKQIKSLIDIILTNARDWYLIQDIAGGEKLVPIELAKKKLSPNLPKRKSENRINEVKDKEIIEKITEDKKDDVNVSPDLQLNVQIHISSDMTEEKIESIFRNMKKYLLDKN